jgi:hypothetical protein
LTATLTTDAQWLVRTAAHPTKMPEGTVTPLPTDWAGQADAKGRLPYRYLAPYDQPAVVRDARLMRHGSHWPDRDRIVRSLRGGRPERHGIDLDADPARASALLGPLAWALIEVPSPSAARDAPALDLGALRAAIEAVERT